MLVTEKKKETVDRTDDPVRMYLREMGAVELLSREGEIAIAKRIEAGRDTMILGLCESPITFHAIIEWSTALNNGEMQLREILDLDAMLSKDPAPESLSDDEEGDDDGEISEKTAGPSFKDEDEVEEEPEADDEDEDSHGRAPRPPPGRGRGRGRQHPQPRPDGRDPEARGRSAASSSPGNRHGAPRVPPHRCRRASARPASPRRKWSRPTCAS
jgi:hypothetical protein